MLYIACVINRKYIYKALLSWKDGIGLHSREATPWAASWPIWGLCRWWLDSNKTSCQLMNYWCLTMQALIIILKVCLYSRGPIHKSQHMRALGSAHYHNAFNYSIRNLKVLTSHWALKSYFSLSSQTNNNPPRSNLD